MNINLSEKNELSFQLKCNMHYFTTSKHIKDIERKGYTLCEHTHSLNYVYSILSMIPAGEHTSKSNSLTFHQNQSPTNNQTRH